MTPDPQQHERARALYQKLHTPNHYLDAMDIEIIAAALANEEQRVWDVVEQHFTTGDPGACFSNGFHVRWCRQRRGERAIT